MHVITKKKQEIQLRNNEFETTDKNVHNQAEFQELSLELDLPGTLLGGGLGISLGAALGLVLGKELGLLLGERLGAAEGLELEVGVAVGERLGVAEGRVLGLELGGALGVFDGLLLGLTLEVGCILGDELGALVSRNTRLKGIIQFLSALGVASFFSILFLSSRVKNRL